MKGIWSVTRRELGSYLSSAMVYVFIAMFTLICGYFFYKNFLYFSVLSMQSDYDGGSMVLNITEAVFRPVHSNYVFVMLIFVPLITMRLFAEEKKSGTLELLISYPLRYADVVFAKILSAFIILVISLVLTMLFPIMAASFGQVETAPLITSYIGLALIGLAFVSVGTFFSSLTENQLIAAVLGFGVLLLLWALEWTAQLLPGVIGKVLSEMSVYNHFTDFNRGVLNSNDFVYYLNLTVVFFMFTLFNLQRRTWKS